MPRHQTAIVAGLVLVLLGFGNWVTGHAKVVEHEQLLASISTPVRVQEYEEFNQLTARTNARLLRPLQAKNDVRTATVQKLDFYRVVESGGRLVMLFGLFTVVVALIVRWYQRKVDTRLPAVFSS